MKYNFLIRIALYILINIVIVFILTRVVNATNLGKNHIDEKRFEIFYGLPDTITAITLGNSHNLSIDFSVLQEPGYHLWRPGQDIFESYALAKDILNYKPGIEKIYYPVDFLFLLDNSVLRINELESVRSRFYYTNAGLSQQKFIWLEGDFWNWIASNISRLNKLTTYSEPENLITVYGQKLLPRYKEQLKQNFPFKKELNHEWGHINIITRSVHDSFSKHKIIKEYKKLIALAESRDVDIIFYAPPHHYKYLELINLDQPHLWVEILTIIDSFVSSDNCRFLNYLDNDQFIYCNEYFMDDDHLNLNIGAPKFSAMFKSQLCDI